MRKTGVLASTGVSPPKGLCNSTQGTAPNFVNARISTSYAGAAADFTPAVGSGLIAAGDATNGATIDWFGAARPNPPAIGALEYVASTATIGRAYLFFSGGGF